MNKPKASAGVIVKNREPDESAQPSESNDEKQAIEACIQDFMQALQANDTARMAEIVKNTHDLLHEYMDGNNNPEPHSYDAQNAIASKGE